MLAIADHAFFGSLIRNSGRCGSTKIGQSRGLVRSLARAKVLSIPKLEWKPDLQSNRQDDDLGAGFATLE